MSERHQVVILFDVDNTLLDNDRVTADLSSHLVKHFGEPARKRYFEIFETLRSELGYADYLGALQRYRVENPTDPRLLAMSAFLITYPFANRLYPNSIDAINHARQFGPAVILSDGDVVFQPRKVDRSGIGEAVDHNVLIYIHKEEMLADVEHRFPADHYILVDDKVRILTAVKKIWGKKVTTVFPVQGHYATPETIAKYPKADITISRIGEFNSLDLKQMITAASNA